MSNSTYNGLLCDIPLQYTFKLCRGKPPEKVMLEANRYFVPDLNEKRDIQFNNNDTCCIYDNKYKKLLNTCNRVYNNTILERTINLRAHNNKVIKQTYYIPLCVVFLGDPPNTNSISVDHIDINHHNNCLTNLRWASPTIQNNNRNYNTTYEEAEDWIYTFENKEYSTNIELYNYLITNNRLSKTIPPKRFKEVLQRNCKQYNLVYSLKITRKIKELNTYGPEIWKELDKSLGLKQYSQISNYGRVGKIVNECIIPKTLSLNKFGYRCIKLKQKHTFISAHSLVYTHFIGSILPGYIIDHIDENKQNNHVSNLQLLTHSENIQKTMNINENHKGTNSIEFKNIVTNEILNFNSFALASKHFNITLGTLLYKIKTQQNKLNIDNQDYEIKINYKNRDIVNTHNAHKVHMVDKNNKIIQSFKSHKAVYKYYKDNGYKFSPDVFKKCVNKKVSYRIPDVFWMS
jgi:hypothetical protein